MTCGAVFDLDGLLIDSERWSWHAHNAVLESVGLAPFSMQEVRTLVGLDSIEEWPAIARMREVQLSREDYNQAQGAAFGRLRDALISPMPGAVSLVEMLCEAGLLLGVASNSPRSSVEAALARLQVRHAFTATACIDDVSAGKPDPEVYRLALQIMGCTSDMAFALEDSAVGVHAASAAGLFVIAVPNELTRALDFSRADVILPDLVAVRDWLVSTPRGRQLLQGLVG